MVDLLYGLNDSQLLAVQDYDGVMLIIAGAGTGKTKTITHRVANIINHGVAPSQILMLTFTNKAANEMKSRINSLVDGASLQGLTAGTFHSFCNMILRKYAKQIGYSNDFTIISERDDIDILNLVKAENKNIFDIPKFPSSKLICSFISKSINLGMSFDELAEQVGGNISLFTDQIKILYHDSIEYKKNHNMMNYDDLLVYTNHLLRTNENVAKIISDTYQYVLVDEYQDTNKLQVQIIKGIRQGMYKNLAVVGDDMQSLYAFRGAYVGNILHFNKEFDDCKTVYLEQNYRSTQEILDLSNYCCNQATEGFKKTLVSNNKRGNKPVVHRPYDLKEEAELAVDLINQYINTNIPMNEIAVLVRNAASSTRLEIELQKAGIPFVKYGGVQFLQTEYVQDILAYMRVIKNRTDELAWFRILKNHRWIGDINSRRISRACSVKGYDELLSSEYMKKKYVHDIRHLREVIINAMNMNLAQLTDMTIEYYYDIRKKNIAEMNIKGSNAEDKRQEYYEENESIYEHLQLLKEIIKDYDNIADFLDDVMLDNRKSENTEENAVVISTIHSAKGLEYETVIILDAVDGIFPRTESWQRGEEEDNEELRCMYVAMTRTKSNLHIICPQTASIYGKSIVGYISHYIKDADDLFIVSEDTFPSAEEE